MTTLSSDWRTPDTEELWRAVLALRTADEAAAFFRDLCTFQELSELSQRWAVVRLLESALPYREIADRSGASTTTITRINQWRQHGTGGYRLVLDRLRRRR
jgi:TrpR-related protein YerC/YecD